MSWWSCYVPLHVAGSGGNRLIGKVEATEEEITRAWVTARGSTRRPVWLSSTSDPERTDAAAVDLRVDDCCAGVQRQGGRMTEFSDLFEVHTSTVQTEGFDDGFVAGFLAGADHAMNYIMGWRGETRNPINEDLAREVLSGMIGEPDDEYIVSYANGMAEAAREEIEDEAKEAEYWAYRGVLTV